MNGHTCGTCLWQRDKLCRRHPPTVVLRQDGGHSAVTSRGASEAALTRWPRVDLRDDWCAEHPKLRDMAGGA